MDRCKFLQSFYTGRNCKVCGFRCDNSGSFLTGHKSTDGQHLVESAHCLQKTHSNRVCRQGLKRFSTFKLCPKTASLSGMRESHSIWWVNNHIVVLVRPNHPRMTGNFVSIPVYQKKKIYGIFTRKVWKTQVTLAILLWTKTSSAHRKTLAKKPAVEFTSKCKEMHWKQTRIFLDGKETIILSLLIINSSYSCGIRQIFLRTWNNSSSDINSCHTDHQDICGEKERGNWQIQMASFQ